jgi:hypothetical protein
MSNNNNESYDTIPSPTNIDDSDTLNTDINNTKDSNKMNNPKGKKIEWSPENELIMVEWCDVAQCYKWLNSRSHAKYAYLHAWFTIPAIIFSTISGTASFAQESFPDSIKAYAPSVIGSINITIGILTTIHQQPLPNLIRPSHCHVQLVDDPPSWRQLQYHLSHPNGGSRGLLPLSLRTICT